MNRRDPRPKLGDVAQVLRGLEGGPANKAMRRELVAAWCKMALPSHEEKFPAPPPSTPPATPSTSLSDAPSTPRIRETLKCLLTGDSEKQIAFKLGISQHTVHVYVKRLYKHYSVNSRGELLARFVAPTN